MPNKYSIFSLIKNSFSYHENWQKAWGDWTVNDLKENKGWLFELDPSDQKEITEATKVSLSTNKNIFELGCGPLFGWGPIAIALGANTYYYHDPGLRRDAEFIYYDHEVIS